VAGCGSSARVRARMHVRASTRPGAANQLRRAVSSADADTSDSYAVDAATRLRVACARASSDGGSRLACQRSSRRRPPGPSEGSSQRADVVSGCGLFRVRAAARPRRASLRSSVSSPTRQIRIVSSSPAVPAPVSPSAPRSRPLGDELLTCARSDKANTVRSRATQTRRPAHEQAALPPARFAVPAGSVRPDKRRSLVPPRAPIAALRTAVSAFKDAASRDQRRDRPQRPHTTARA